MKKYFVLFICLLVISNVSALRINEVELNPAGDDSGNEWVELYSKNEVNLENYKLVNNDGGEINLSGSFSGYHVYTFSKQWLDNSDEKVLLYEGDELIDETEIIYDSRNDGRGLSYCDKEWWFVELTKEKENNCEVEEEDSEEKDSEEESTQDKEDSFADTEGVIESENSDDEETEIINLVPKDIKSENDNEDLDKSVYAKYGFVIFCILLGILFMFRRNR